MRSTSAARSFWLAMGLVLTFAGLQAIQEETLLFAYPPFLSLAERWSQALRLEIFNLPNFLIGLLALLIGGGLTVASLDLPAWTAEAAAFRLPDLPAIQWDYVRPRLLGSLALFALLLLQLGTHSYSDISLLFWLVSLLTLTLLFWKRERGASVDLSLHVAWQDGAWMLLLFALGIGIGAYRLNDVPAWVAADEGAFWGTAHSIATGELQPAFFDFGVYSFPVASSIFQAWALRLAGMDLWAWRFASVLSACLTIFPLYLLGRELFDRRVAIAACVLMIVNPYFLAFARLGYNNSQAILPVTLTVYFLALGLRRGSYFYLWLAGMAAGLGYYTYFAAWLGLIVVGVAALTLPFTTRIPFRKTLPLLLVPLAGWFAIALPRIVYSLSSPIAVSMYYKVLETSFVSGFYGRAMFGDTFINQAPTWSPGEMEIFFGLPQYGILWMRGLLRSVAALFDPTIYNGHFLTAELAGPGASFFFVFGAGIALAGLRKIHYFLLNTWFWIGLLFLSILAAFPPRPNHTVPLIPVMALLAALGLVAVAETATKQIARLAARRKTWETSALPLALLVIAGMGFRAYFVEVPLYYAPDFDHRASWIIRNAPASARAIFVDEVPTAHDAEYQSQTHLTDHEILTALRADLEGVLVKTFRHDFLAFVAAADNGEQVAADLTRLLPQATLQRLSNPDGTPLGFVLSNIPVQVEPSAQPADGLRDLWASPARALIIACVLAALILFAFGSLIPRKASETGSALQTLSSEKKIQWPGIELEFRFRIHFPTRARAEADPPKKREETNAENREIEK